MREATVTMLAVSVWACVGGTQAWARTPGVPFADVVLPSWYAPAPGQFVNTPQFNDPTRAIGAPTGGGPTAPDNTSQLTLGGFGGSVVLGFSAPVFDDPLNPMGLDAIVFGNAFYVNANPIRRWAEAGVIEISRDVNGNGLPDDAWYVIRSPALADPPVGAQPSVLWDDDPFTMTPPLNPGWYPSGVGAGSYTTSGLLLAGVFNSIVLENSDALLEDAPGLADLTPTLALGDTDADGVVEDPAAAPEDFYTRPDSPFLVGIAAGSAGGAAFDIAWAVDALTGMPAGLDGFDFVRITTGPNALAGAFGEISTEVDAIARVSPDPLWYDETGDGVLDIEDLYAARTDVRRDATVDGIDEQLVRRAVRAQLDGVPAR